MTQYRGDGNEVGLCLRQLFHLQGDCFLVQEFPNLATRWQAAPPQRFCCSRVPVTKDPRLSVPEHRLWAHLTYPIRCPLGKLGKSREGWA